MKTLFLRDSKLMIRLQQGEFIVANPDFFFQDNANPTDQERSLLYALLDGHEHSGEVEIIMSDGWQPSYNNPDNSGCEQPAEPIAVKLLPKLEKPHVATKEWEEMIMKIQDHELDQQDSRPLCKACEIEKKDELVKQMPEHTCSKGSPIDKAQPKSAAHSFTEGDYKQFDRNLNSPYICPIDNKPCYMSNCIHSDTQPALCGNKAEKIKPVSPSETQEELWKIVYGASNTITQAGFIEAMKEHFTLTRKPT